MEEFFGSYALFLAETVTLVIAIVAIGLFLVAISSSHGEKKEHLEIEKLNDKFDSMTTALQSHILPKHELKKTLKEQKRQKKALEKNPPSSDKGESQRGRIFVLTFDGDIKASSVGALAEEITAILTIANEEDEVFLHLYSAGGLVHAYGLASAQLQRIKNHKIPLTISVDKVAASGGYMMACVANRIIAAPFAIVGSIGVVAQIPNFHRLLQKHDVDFELHTAGKYKRTLTLFGENSDAAREKFQHDLEETHGLFQDFIGTNRPQVDLDKVATGEYWHGLQALGLQLVDELSTSDDYLLKASANNDIYVIKYSTKTTLANKVSGFFSNVTGQLYNAWQRRNREDTLL